MDLIDSETTFRYVIDIKQKKIYFSIVFRQMFYSVYITS